MQLYPAESWSPSCILYSEYGMQMTSNCKLHVIIAHEEKGNGIQKEDNKDTTLERRKS